jgi:hypothetical protein
MEITHRFTADETTRSRIAHRDMGAAAAAFTRLRRGMSLDLVVVAHWTKQSGAPRDCTVHDAASLVFIMEGFLEGNCSELRFFTKPASELRGRGYSYRDLFLS